MKTKTLIRLITLFLLFYTLYRTLKHQKEVEALLKKKQDVLVVEIPQCPPPIIPVTPVIPIVPTVQDLDLKIYADYSVKAMDSSKRLWVTSAVKLTFNENGRFNIVVRANPVKLYSFTTFVQDLEAGDYLVELLNGTLTII